MARADDISATAKGALKPMPQSLPAALMRAREVIMARVRPVLRAHDLTEPQWRVLRTLGSLKEIEVTQLADMVFLLPSSLSRILRDLGVRGLVQRRTSETDLRRGLVSLSRAGHALIEEVTPEAAAVNAEIDVLFGHERMKTLRSMLVELEQALGWAQPSE